MDTKREREREKKKKKIQRILQGPKYNIDSYIHIYVFNDDNNNNNNNNLIKVQRVIEVFNRK